MPRERGTWNRFHHIDESEVKKCIHRANTNPLPEGKGFINITGLEFADGNIKVIADTKRILKIEKLSGSASVISAEHILLPQVSVFARVRFNRADAWYLKSALSATLRMALLMSFMGIDCSVYIVT